MQILFVHPNFPAQFGPIASHLAAAGAAECVFFSRNATGERQGIRCLRYEVKGGASRATHYCARTFESAVWSAHGVYQACKAADGLRPDLIVGHSGFATTVFLRELFDCPIVSYFEYYYHPVLRQNPSTSVVDGSCSGRARRGPGSLDARPCSADRLQALETGRRQGCRHPPAVGLAR